MNSSLQNHGFGDFLKWQWDRISTKLPSKNPSNYKIVASVNDGLKLRENKTKFTATWVGHATTLIQIQGKNILTDPIWSDRCSPVSFAGPKRYTEPGIKMENLPNIDIVLISHNHYDHLDLPTLSRLEKMFHPTFITGLKNGDLLKGEGLQTVIELDWWEETVLEDLKIAFTPSQHFSARGLFDRNETLWGSYVVVGKDHTFYFAGDTGYFAGFKMIGKKYPNIDLAILPIGAYNPRWFMKIVHMDPAEAIQALVDLNAKFMLPIHYNTFVLTDEPLDEPLKKTVQIFNQKGIEKDRLKDLKIGETFWVD
ncbi:MAG: MBL fold metallo-hydrolase [Leptospiraceae bacterium]|nr:MBL fold metallo-hydrolase [Leptospiraceae bacterium]MCP5493678.1 MBL fold metallo-hydrolase [Leptospiraceae bacterium]